ncbi:MAG: hypothetical protein LBD59_03885 [Prevotellaceae bacterium]|jgi:class 3 adenylate cyclase|nr:hypothetical protein [Prevotellaceae bacterium]
MTLENSSTTVARTVEGSAMEAGAPDWAFLVSAEESGAPDWAFWSRQGSYRLKDFKDITNVYPLRGNLCIRPDVLSIDITEIVDHQS